MTNPSMPLRLVRCPRPSPPASSNALDPGLERQSHHADLNFSGVLSFVNTSGSVSVHQILLPSLDLSTCPHAFSLSDLKK